MGHVQQSPSSISLHPHILGLCQSCKRSQCSRPCDLCFIVLVGCQVGDATNRIALNLDVWRHHLADKRSEASKEYNSDLILGYTRSDTIYTTRTANSLLTARLPRAALAARCTSISGLCRRNKIGSRVSRSTSRTSAN